VYALRLKEFDLSSVQIGAFFTIITVGAFCAGIGVQYHPKRIDYRAILIASTLVNGIGFMLNGPSNILPNSLILMALGQFISGYAMCIQTVICLSEMVR